MTDMQHVSVKSTRGTSSAGDSSGQRHRKSRSERLSKRITQIQKRIWMILSGSEIILFVVILTQFLVFRHIIYEALAFKTQSELGLIREVEYDVRPNLFALTMSDEAKASEFREMLDPAFYTNAPNITEVDHLQHDLEELIEEFEIEFCMLVSATDYGVLVSGSYSLPPNTKTFNPESIVSDFIESNEHQRIISVLIPRAVFEDHHAPKHVDEEAQSEGDDPHAGHSHGGGHGHEDEDEGNSSWDVDSATLVRFVLTKVTGLSSGVPDGVLVVGDAVTAAKPTFVLQTLKALQSGTVSVALKQSDGSLTVPVHAEHIDEEDGTHDHGVESHDAEIVVVGDHNTDLELVQQALDEPGKVFLHHGEKDPHGHYFTMTAVTAPGTDNVVLLRGFEEEFLRTSIANVAGWNFGLLFLVIIIDIVSALFGIQLFLKPLDRIIKRLKARDFDGFSESIEKMRKSKVLIIRFAVTGVVSLVVLGVTLYVNLDALETGFVHLTTTSAQAHAMEDTYMIKPNQMRFGLQGMAHEDSFREASDVNSATRAQALSDVTAALKEHTLDRQMEMAILVDADYKVIASAGPQANVVGVMNFNHERIVESVLSTGSPVMISATMTYDQIRSLMGADMVFGELTDQHISVSKGIALIRLVAVPVFAPDQDSHGSELPRAVLVGGDIVNGDREMNQLVNRAFNGGYSAVYLYNPDTSDMDLLSGIYQTESLDDTSITNTEQQIAEVELESTDVIFGALMFNFQGKGSFLASTDEEHRLRGIDDTFSIGAAAIPANPDGFADVLAFNVRAQSNAVWNRFINQQLVIQICVIVFQLLSCLVVSYMIYRPLHKFLSTLDANWRQV